MTKHEIKTTEDLKYLTGIEDFTEMYAEPFCLRGFYSPTNGIMTEEELYDYFRSEDMISMEIMYDNAGRFLGMLLELEEYPVEDFGNEEIPSFEDEPLDAFDPDGDQGGEGVAEETPAEEAVAEEAVAEEAVVEEEGHVAEF